VDRVPICFVPPSEPKVSADAGKVLEADTLAPAWSRTIDRTLLKRRRGIRKLRVRLRRAIAQPGTHGGGS